MSPPRGVFVVVEGIDGSGKGTLLTLLERWLAVRKYQVHRTAEPSTLPIGALLRTYLRRERTDAMPDFGAMALLFAADRLQHVEHEIEPALASGAVVLCDRYDHSSLAYQSALVPAEQAEAALAWISTLNARALRPDLVLLLDLDPEQAAARRAERGGEAELFEKTELQKRVRSLYAEVPKYRPSDRIVRIDASLPPPDVAQAAVAALTPLLAPAP